MKNHNSIIQPSFPGWKYYNTKKAIDKELNSHGLLITLSIAFLIIIVIAQLLNLVHQSYLESRLGSEINQSEQIACPDNSCDIAVR